MQSPQSIFDRSLLRARKIRAVPNFAAHDFMFREAAARLADRLDDVTRRFPLALELGAQASSDVWQACGGIERLVRAGFSSGCDIICDEELLPFAEHSFDLVISVLALHWVNDLPGTLAQIRRMLKPDGLFLAVLPGAQTLSELRETFDAASLETTGGIGPRVSPFIDVRDAGSLLQRAGFALPVVDADRLSVAYPDLPALLRDLRGSGESNALLSRPRMPLRRDTLAAAERIYRERFSREDRLLASFELVTLTAWSPHASQQKPAARGSGKVRLGEVLS